MAKARATIVVKDPDDTPSDDYEWVVDWLIRWSEKVRIGGYFTDGLEHIWDVEAGGGIISEIPPQYLRESGWVGTAKGGGARRSSDLGMTFSINKAKRLRNRGRRAKGEL